MIAIKALTLLALTVAVPVPGEAGPSHLASACFSAAAWNWPARTSLDVCTAALRDRSLTPRERGATLVNRGIVAYHARKFGAAIADYDAALAVVPGLTEALIDKGVALVEAGRDAEAVPVLTAAIAEAPPRLEVALYARAMANETIGATRAAYDDYSRAAALAPDWDAPAEQLRRFSVVRRPTARG